MGAPMARHVLDAGHDVVVHTRTKSKADVLLAAGARWADTPAEAAGDAEIVCSIVGMPADVRATHLGPDGTVGVLTPGQVVVDLTTSEPALAAEIADAARARGADALDAPVSGGDVGARNGTLSIMVGGSAAALATARPVLDTFGGSVVRQGDAGAGQHTKLVNQMAIASTMVGVCEALVYAARAGLDVDTVLASIGGGAAGSWTLANLAPRMVAGDTDPGFFVDHFVKDLGIALDEARRLRLAVPGLALAHQLYVSLQAAGGGRFGTQALVEVVARLGATPWPPDPAAPA